MSTFASLSSISLLDRPMRSTGPVFVGYRLFKYHFDYGYLSHEQAFVGIHEFAIFLAHCDFFR